MNISAYLDVIPQTQGPGNTFGATGFTSPSEPILKGLSYSFDYGAAGNSARFVLVDTEATTYKLTTPAAHPIYGPGAFCIVWTVYKHTDVAYPVKDNLFYESYSSAGTEFYPGKQQAWISERLDVTNEERPEHAFVLTHRGPMNQTHVDSMFGSSPGSKVADHNVISANHPDSGSLHDCSRLQYPPNELLSIPGCFRL